MTGTIFNDQHRIKALEDAVEDIQEDVQDLQTLGTAPFWVRTYSATVTCTAGSLSTIQVSTTESAAAFADYTKVAVAGVYLGGTGYGRLALQGFKCMQDEDVVYIRVKNIDTTDVTEASVEVRVLYCKSSLLA